MSHLSILAEPSSATSKAVKSAKYATPLSEEVLLLHLAQKGLDSIGQSIHSFLQCHLPRKLLHFEFAQSTRLVSLQVLAHFVTNVLLHLGTRTSQADGFALCFAFAFAFAGSTPAGSVFIRHRRDGLSTSVFTAGSIFTSTIVLTSDFTAGGMDGKLAGVGPFIGSKPDAKYDGLDGLKIVEPLNPQA